MSNWLDTHLKDRFVKEAFRLGYKSRAIFKLKQLDEKYKLLPKPGKYVLDLGCAPGSWSEYLLEKNLKVIGVDLLETQLMHENFTFLQGNVLSSEILQQIKTISMANIAFICSDMAPNMMGNRQMDALRALNLVEKVVDISTMLLKPKGNLVLKVFNGVDLNPLVLQLRKQFKLVKICKPEASRKQSSEMYLVAMERS